MQKKDEEIEHLTQTLEEVKQTSLSREYELQVNKTPYMCVWGGVSVCIKLVKDSPMPSREG